VFISQGYLMRSVLVVDDEELLLDVIRSFLERFGNMQVQTVSSSKEALSLLSNTSFDALVLDYYLPEITGIELLKILRAKGDTTPVIIFTGVGRENAAIEALNNGADFFLKKGDSPSSEFRELVHMINRSIERRFMGRSMGISQKILMDTINVFQEAAFAIDREGKVLAWNQGMTELTGVDPRDMIGKGDGAYSVPIIKRKAPLLSDLIFESDETIARNKYTIIKKEQDSVFAWTKVTGDTEGGNVLWMKATPLYDAKGAFIAIITQVKDITDELGEELLRQTEFNPDEAAENPEKPTPAQASMLNKLFGKAKSIHREGLALSFGEGKYQEAIPVFTRAIDMDPNFAYAWFDRGVCQRELGRDDEALKDFTRAAELLPDDEEVLYGLADLLKKIGILQGQNTALEAAIGIFNKILEINPNNADAWNGLAICMNQLGKNEIAKQYFQRSTDLIKRGISSFKKRSLY
jgi:DNA-binding response OmpR family regulator/regulator of sirC expression with transglutaminase-like and TPR domain